MLEKSGLLSSSSPLRRSSSESMLERLCNDDDVLDSSNGNILDDEFDKDLDDRNGFSRTQSCASLTNAEPAVVVEDDLRRKSSAAMKGRLSQSTPSLLSRGEIERIALDAAQSQDVGFLKSSVETLKDQLGRLVALEHVRS